MRTVTLPVKLELSNAAVVKPGDKLVVATPRLIARELAAQIKAEIGAALPGVEIVLADGVSALAVYAENDDRVIRRALRDIWNRIEESDEGISPAWLRRVIVESGAWDGEDSE